MSCSLGGLFGTTQNTNQQTNSNQSGTTTNPLAGTIIDYAKNNVLPQFSASNINSIAPNQWMTGAATNQAGVGANLFPAFNAASGIAQNGVTSMDINRFMNPYIQNVVDASNRQADFNDARILGQAQGSGALHGSLTNSASKANQDYMRSVLGANRNAMSANLYNTGYNTAVGNAFQNNAGILSAASGLGSLAGAATGANLGLGNLGQNVFAAGLTPYNLATQGASTFNSLVPGAGSSYSGNTSGTTTGTTDTSQGLGTIGAGLLGAWLMGRKASGGAVMPAFEGHQRGMHDRLQSTVKALHGMMRSDGGAIQRFETGGVPEPSSNPQPAMSGLTPTSSVIPPFQTTTTPEPQSSMWDTFKSYLPSYDQGVWAGEKASPTQRFGMALTQVGMNNPFKDFGKSAFEQANIEEQRRQQERMQQQRMAQEAAIAAGQVNVNGKTMSTVDAARLEEAKRQHNAQIALQEKQLASDALKVNQLTGDYYSANPSSPFFPKMGTPDPNAGLSAITRKEWAKTEAPKQIVKSAEEYNTANDVVNKLTDVEALMPHMVSGSWAGAELEARKMLARAGFGNADKIATTELARALTQTLILDATKALKPASNLDVQFTQKATASIENDPSTLKVLLPGLRATALRSQMKAEIVGSELRNGRIPDYPAIDKMVDAQIPSPYQTYAAELGLRNPNSVATPREAAPRTQNEVQSGLTKDQLLKAPNGPLGNSNYIKFGDKLLPREGEPGTMKNAYPATESWKANPGEFFWKDGALYKRTGFKAAEGPLDPNTGEPLPK